MLRIDDADRIRTITLDRPEALNAFNEALYDATTEALIAAAGDPAVAVVVITGTGRSFSAGTDVLEMASRTTNPGAFEAGVHGFPGVVDELAAFLNWHDTKDGRWRIVVVVFGLSGLVGLGGIIYALVDIVVQVVRSF